VQSRLRIIRTNRHASDWLTVACQPQPLRGSCMRLAVRGRSSNHLSDWIVAARSRRTAERRGSESAVHTTRSGIKTHICESKIKDGGILGSRCASWGIRWSIQIEAEIFSVSARGAESVNERQFRRRSQSILVPTNYQQVSAARPTRCGFCVVHGNRRRSRSLEANLSRTAFACSPCSSSPMIAPMASSNNSPTGKGGSATSSDHFGPHESRWAKNSPVIPADQTKVSRLYLAFASCTSMAPFPDPLTAGNQQHKAC
jgi:hypothetical protein